MLLRTTITFLFYLLLSLLTNAQSFQKVLRKSDNSFHFTKKLLELNEMERALLTNTDFYRMDEQGNILKQATIGSDNYYLQDIIQLSNGQFVVAGSKYTGTKPAIKLTLLDADGQELQIKEFNIDESMGELHLVSSVNSHFFLVFVHTERDRRHTDLMYFDAQFETVWEQHHGWLVHHEIHTIAGSNGGVEFIHQNPVDLMPLHFKYDTEGNLTEQPVLYIGPSNDLSIINRVIKTPEGGYLYCGIHYSGIKNEDILLLKTDERGNTEWVKYHDFYLGDIDEDLKLTEDGYILLARTGYSYLESNGNSLDMTLVKLDRSGNAVWSKAYGTAGVDFAKNVLVNKDGSFTVAGQATTYFMTLTEPVLFRTDIAGNFPNHAFPLPLQSPSPIVPINAIPESPVQRMINAALLPDGGILIAGSKIDPAAEKPDAFISRADAQGNQLWQKPASISDGDMVMMKPMADGSFLSAIQVINPFFLNDYHITKLDADGNAGWTTQVYASNIRDAVMAPDGGYLLCGMENEGMGNVVRMLCVIKLNKQGDQVWKYKHRLDNKWIYGRSIQITPENDILVAGLIQDMQSNVSATYLCKLDQQGILKWHKTFPRGNNMAIGNKVIVTTGNEYLVTGLVRYPGERDKQDLLLLKTNNSGNLLWEKEYHIDKMDAGNSVIEYGGQYYIAGTTGQPEFGARECFGLLFRTDINGIQKGFSTFGNQSTTLACSDFYKDAQNKMHFMGTVQQPYGIERVFRAILESDIVLGSREPVPEKAVQLYPVPASHTAFISIDHPYAGTIRISITGISGVQLYNQTFQKPQQRLTIALPVGGFSNGVYLVETMMGKMRITQKLVIGK